MARLACGLDVATVHLESLDAFAEARAAQLRVIQPALAAASEDVVVVGDFNFDAEAAIETAALDPSFVDVWPALRPDEPGYSVDPERNAMRLPSAGVPARRRIDRALVRAARWRPEAIEPIGTLPIDGDGTFVSDHFGLELAAQRADHA